MILNKQKIGVLVVVLVVVGGVLVFAGQQNKDLLTADISQVVDSINTEDNSVEAAEAPEDAGTEPQNLEEEVIEPAPQPQPQAIPVPLALQKVWVSPASVPAGGEITVTVDTSDILSFILFVDVYLENADSGQTVQGSIVNIDGEGRKFGSITIPSDAEQGEWMIKKVSIVDTSGSTTDYHDGKEISAGFTVISP